MSDEEDEIPDMKEALEDATPRLSPEEAGEECPNCGYDFDADEWDVRHLSGGPFIGEDWLYTCPECEKETIEIGT